MEKARKIRSPVRASFTRTEKEVVDELAKKPVDFNLIQDKMKLLGSTYTRMEELDFKVIEAMVDDKKTDEEVSAEQEIIDDYRSRWIALQRHVEAVLCPRPPSPSPSSASGIGTSKRDKRKTYRLPKTEIKKFGGEITEWLSWWAQFQKIHEDEELHDADKFQYLVQAMENKSKAAELVQVYPQTAANYPKAIGALRDRFGKEKILKRVYVRELLKMINQNSRERTKISKTYDKLEAHLKALESLGISAEQMDVLLFPMVESCLPEEILVAWQRSPNYGKEDKDHKSQKIIKTEFEYMMEFINQEVENEGQRAMAQSGFSYIKENRNGYQNQVRKGKGDVSTATNLYNKPESVGCIFCGRSNHSGADCYRTKHLSMEDKQKKIKESRSCFVCLKKGHQSKYCRTSVKCTACGGKHLKVMCSVGDRTVESNQPQQTQEVPGTVEVQNLFVNQPQSSVVRDVHRNKVILMKTLCVRAIGEDGLTIQVRLLFDEGSQRSYIKTSLAQMLKCREVKKLMVQNNLFGGAVSAVKNRQVLEVTLAGIYKKCKKSLQLVNEDTICTGCPIVTQGPWMKELSDRNIKLSDTAEVSSEIEILIGSDLWGSLMTGKMVKLACGLIAVESVFGWTLSGPLPISETSCAATVISLCISEKRSIEDMWSLETLGIRDSAEKISQEEHDFTVKRNLQKKAFRDKEGRYVIQLPWISNSVEVPSNKQVAVKMLISATEKLRKQGGYGNYSKIFSDWEKEGIIERVPQSDIGKGHFLPHRAVYKPESLTTPVRPVFNASFRVGKQPSLNQCLEKGPNLLELIPSILLRFREKQVGVIADIRKAFQMISVAEEERNNQKFLWWDEEGSKEPIEYRHCRVVFGMNCSPFVLAAVLELHLSQVEEEDVETADLLMKCNYVDNCSPSFDTVEEYETFKRKSTAMLDEAKMELRQWESNVEKSDNPITTVLGYKWDKSTDELFCKIPKEDGEATTINKRYVLSTVSQVFDPIGFTCPAVIQPKIQLQDSWAVSMNWDTEWPEEEKKKYLRWREELSDLSQIRIPRETIGNSRKYLQIHMFSDASKSAYAAVVFARVGDGDRVTVRILSAKSRLAPLDKKKTKKMTIPRLELMGCLIGSRMLSSIVKDLNVEGVPVYCWSDSSTALSWIKRKEDWGTFVGRRVEEIGRLTSQYNWRHVPGVMNPADLPSRGCTPSELKESKWWEGPEWLKNEELWPRDNTVIDEEEVLQERRKTPVVTAVGTSEDVKLRFSTYMSNVRVAAWVRRFVENARKAAATRNFKKYPSLKELKVGEQDLLQEIQRRHFREKPNLKGLWILEKEGMFHVRTRLLHLDDTELFKEPILLPKEDPLVHQLIEHVHKANCHAGTQFVLGKLRENYWVVHGRKAVSHVIHKCVVCKRHAARSLESDPAPLPRVRINAQFAFQTTGVDLAGPLLLKGKKKAWIVLYTCAVYRGVHLDIVDTLTSDEFLDSLEKFTFTVGRPRTMYSDNGTNFVGAENMMKKLDWKKLEDKLQVKRIQWTFNPPTASWWGGFWERLVRSIKDLLKRMIGTARLTRKELEKCLMSISHTINNRPLTTLTEDSDDLIPLTPAMFIKDLPLAGLPELDEMTPQDMEQAYKKLVDLKKSLKERFRKEYLALLVQNKNEKGRVPPEVGDVVLVGQDNKKRFEWPLGRIEELFPGSDDKIRLAKVKTAHGFLLRPLKRLFPLEIKCAIDVPMKKSELQVIKAESTKKETAVEEKGVKTRSGRIIRKPRYGAWNT